MKQQRGSALVEFALGAVFLVSLFTGIFQFGYSFYLYNTLESSVRAAAQYAALETYPACYDQRVRNMVVYGNPNGGTEPLLPGLSANNVAVEMALRDGVPSTVSVRISSYVLNAVFHSFSLANKPQVTMPYLGRWAKEGGCS